MKELTVEELYYPNRKRLGSIIAGLSGAGKTTAVLSTLQQAINSPTFGEFHRFVIVDPKIQQGDYDILSPPIMNLEKAFKNIRKERVTVYWPNVNDLEYEVSSLINYLFELSNSNPRTTFTFVLDEASILITPTRIPAAVKKLAVQGRAKRILPIWISQRPIVNRWTDCNVSSMLLFRILPVDADVLSKRWGLDFESADETLQEQSYSFMHFDLEKATLNKMNPVELPKPPKKKKRTMKDKFLSLI